MNTDETDKKKECEEFEEFDDILYEYHDGNLLKGVISFGFDKPSLIQSRTIMHICKKRDLIAQAQSGSGKTGAFVIGSLARVNLSKKHPQIIIIENTRELANQVYYVLTKIGQYMISDMGLNVCLCVGGKTGERNDSMANLNEASKSHILIGTPGRLTDLIERDKKNKNDSFNKLSIMVFDEADILLSGDFLTQMKKLISFTKEDTQICLFSATYTEEVLKITKRFLSNPIQILMDKEEVSVKAIKNYFVNVRNQDDKFDVLQDLYQKLNICQVVIFVNSVTRAMKLSDLLKSQGHVVGIIHSKLSDVERQEELKKFRLTQTRVLIATDLISRGIDVQQVGLVINYDVPMDCEQYIHRVGRGGRYFRSSVAITFVDIMKDRDGEKMMEIERTYNINFKPLDDPENVNLYLTGER